MKRNIICTLLAAVMVLSFCITMNLQAVAEETREYDIVHTMDNGKLYFNSETGTIVGAEVSGVLEIPAQIQGHDVLIIGESAFSNVMGLNPITEVTVPEGVTTLEQGAFNYCQQLMRITLPGSLRSIGFLTFGHCLIQEIVIPEGVETIGESAFYECIGLKEVSLPDSLVQMGTFVFSNCERLQTVRLPATMTRIEQGTFKGCEKLAQIRFPSTLKEIGADAFRDCKALAEVALPDGLTTLEEGAFRDCIGLVKVSLPDAMTEIGPGAFSGCKTLPEIQLPSGLKRIGASAFSGNYKLAPVTFPDTLEEIGSSAFSTCYQFKHIDFPKNLKVIGSYAFSYCPLEGVDLPESLERLGYNAFYDNKEITVHDNGKYLDGWFVGVDGLSYTVHIKEGTVGVAEESLRIYRPYESGYAGNVHTVQIPKSVVHIGREAFGTKNTMRTVIVDQGNPVYSSYSNLLYNKDQTELIFCGAEVYQNQLKFPNGLKKIGEGAFSYCQQISTIMLPDTVEIIGKNAFSQSTLEAIHMGSSLRLIEDGAFLYCKNLACAYFYGDAPQVGAGTFDGCPGIILFYGKDGAGWTFPKWNGYATSVMRDGQLAAAAFSDVTADAYYADPVGWAVSEGITNGTGGGKFSPDMGCTRGQIVTFLWRAEGCPEPTSRDNPFTDVQPKDYYYKAVLWAVEKGITDGTGHGRFSPDRLCTRGQAVTFLWRNQGKPSTASSQKGFSDVAKGAYYYDAVLWAVEQQITNGMSKELFAPDKSCTRGQIVTFLYRSYP